MDSSGARDMHPIALTLISLSVWVGPPAKLKPDESGQNAATHVTLQNNMLPGHLTIHEITRTVRRTVKRPKFVETLSYEQIATLVQCNIAQPQPGKILTYQ